MKTKFLFRLLPALVLALSVALASFGQAPKRYFSEVYYFKLKPGHTFAEARTIEKEFKKIHQVQADEGFIDGWYMLGLQTTTNPSKEYDYVTIKNFSNLSYLDNAYPEAAMKKGWGTDYQKKMTDLSKQMQEVYEVTKTEIWEGLEDAAANPIPSPDKAPFWVVSNTKVKNGQYEEYIEHIRQMKPYSQERVNRGEGTSWTVSGLMLPWATEKGYDFSTVIRFASLKDVVDSYSEAKAESAFKKAMPNVDGKQFFKELNALRETARQEVYYMLEFAVKNPNPAVSLDAKVLDSYVGVYEGKFLENPKATFTVTREGNRLFEQITGGRNLELVALSESRFAFAQMDAQIEFVRDASGKIVKRTLDMGGITSEAKKIK